MEIYEKQERLKESLRSLGGVAVAFSGGVDSTYLLKMAKDVLGDKAVAVTARSRSFPLREQNEAASFCAKEGIRQFVCDTDELSVEGFAQSPENRCYLCKREIFQRIWSVARENGLSHVAEGSNMDDLGDYRPGLTAIRELAVKSPLREAGLAKDEIRRLSREAGLPTWDKPSFACLVSRFPYGEHITEERLSMIDRAEQVLLDMGLRQVRVRFHGQIARIETDEEGFALLAGRGRRETVYEAFRQIGFPYAALDLMGYRTGSMNETLREAQKKRYILFDLDGTLTDPYEGISRSFQHAFSHFGITENDPDKLRRMIGPPLRDTFASYGVAPETAVKVYRERFGSVGLYENKLYDGIPELLAELGRRGYILAVASSKAEYYVEKITAHFGIDRFFSFIGGAELEGGRSDKAEVIRYVLSALGTQPGDEIHMVGDREHDMHGAKKCGVRSVGVLYGYGSEEELRDAAADYVAADVGALRKFFCKP